MPADKPDARFSALRAGATLPIALTAILFSGSALAECDRKSICFHEEKYDDHIQLRAENLTEFPLTYTVRVRTRNLTTNGPRKITRTLSAGDSEIAMSLTKTASNQEGRFRYSFDWTVGDKNAVHDDDHIYQLPYESGKSYRVIQGFGSRFSHTGLEQFAIDFLMKEGTPVHAARGGIVARVAESNSIGCWSDGCGRYANYIVVLHDDGTTGEYYHLKKDGALVGIGERVFAGQKIALSGNTGHTTVPHLHFAVYRAVEWGNTQSIPVRFSSADGIIDRPRRGGRYQATPIRQASIDLADDLKTYTTE